MAVLKRFNRLFEPLFVANGFVAAALWLVSQTGVPMTDLAARLLLTPTCILLFLLIVSGCSLLIIPAQDDVTVKAGL